MSDTGNTLAGAPAAAPPTFGIDPANLPRLNVGNFVPDALAPVSPISQPHQPLDINQPSAVRALESKYAPGGYFDALSTQYNSTVVNALRAYDAQRVAKGQAPLSQQQTIDSLKAAQTNQPTTPPPDRSLWNVPGNAISDVTSLIASIPRIPTALFKEASHVGDIPSAIASAKNPIAGLANAPVLRMLPGSYTLGNLANGTPGELLRHPLFTALDLLPAGEKLAELSPAAREASRVAEGVAKGEIKVGLGEGELSPRDARIVGKQATRPITTTLLNRLPQSTEDLVGGPVLERNSAGEMVDKLAQTKPGRFLAKTFSSNSRDVMFAVQSAVQRTRGVMSGAIAPEDALGQIARETVQLRDNLAAIDPALVDNINTLTQRMQLGNFDGMSTNELRGVEQVRQMNQRMGDWMAQNQHAVYFNNELYDVATGQKLLESDRNVTRSAHFNALRKQLLSTDAGTVDAQALAQQIHDATQPNAVSGKVSAEGAMTRKALTRQLKNAGYDTTELDQLWTNSQRGNRTVNAKGAPLPVNSLADYHIALQDVVNGGTTLTQTPRMGLNEIVDYLKAHGSEDTTAGVDKIQAGINNGEWKTVSEGLDQIQRSKSPALSSPDFIASVREARDNARFIDKDLGTFTDTRHQTRINQLNRLKSESVPARFIPKVAELTRQGLKDRLIPVGDAAEAARINQLADRGQWTQIPGFDEKVYGQVQREAARTWQSMRDNGLDPVYVHSVTPGKVGVATNPLEAIVPTDPSSVRARVLNMAPSLNDVSVALTHQAMEFLSRQHIETAIKTIADSQGVSEAALRAQYAETAASRAARNGALDYEGHLQRLMNENWKRFDPDEMGYKWGSAYLDRLKQDGTWIPKTAYDNLKALSEPRQILGGVMDPVTGLFRMATTALSLRTQLYNILGGGIAVEVDRPGALLRAGAQAREWMKDPSLMPDSLKVIVGQQKHTLMDLDKESLGIINEGVLGHLRGKMLKRFWDSEQAAKVEGTPILGRYGGKIKGLVQKSYDLNGMFDDFYRITSYIDSYKSSIAKGYTAKAAEDAAVATTRRVLQDWMGMTPVERSVVKSIFPFYSYMGHALRFVLKYPLDHPLRTEILAKVAQSELEDQGSLPSRFLSMLFFGGTGASGERNALNLGPLNPFGGVSNWMSIQGLLGNTNPLIKTALESVGVKNGTADLYPTLTYDPETGRLAADTGNPLELLLQNTIPQSNVLTAILGINNQYRDQLKTDPAGALRYLASAMTIPVPWRSIQIPQEQFKAEIARETAATQTQSAAVKSGDWSEALMYPSLRQYFAALDQLPANELAPYQPLTPQQIQAAQGGKVNGNVTLPNFKGAQPIKDLVAQLIKAQSGTGGTAPLQPTPRQAQAMPLDSAPTATPTPGQFTPGGSIAAAF